MIELILSLKILLNFFYPQEQVGVLNDEYRSFCHETKEFPLARKNQFEENVSQVEDERYEVEYALRLLETIFYHIIYRVIHA